MNRPSVIHIDAAHKKIVIFVSSKQLWSTVLKENCHRWRSISTMRTGDFVGDFTRNFSWCPVDKASSRLGEHTSQLFTLLLTKISCPSCFQSEKSKALKSCSCIGGVIEIGTSMSAEISGHLGEGLTALAFDLKFS